MIDLSPPWDKLPLIRVISELEVTILELTAQLNGMPMSKDQAQFTEEKLRFFQRCHQSLLLRLSRCN